MSYCWHYLVMLRTENSCDVITVTLPKDDAEYAAEYAAFSYANRWRDDPGRYIADVIASERGGDARRDARR